MNDGGKGDSPRPFSVSQEEFANNFERIFGKKPNKKSVDSSEQPSNNQEQSTKANDNERTLD